MGALNFSRCALGTSVAAALLAACSASSMPFGGVKGAGLGSASSGSQTFSYTGKKQTFVVPQGVTQLAVVVRGAGGGDAGTHGSPSFVPPAAGGRVDATFVVQSGEKLYVFVGGHGLRGPGGFNGGGGGAWGGGGASDIRAGGDALQDRIVVAAGGGGTGGQTLYDYGIGGSGGGLRGRAGGPDSTGCHDNGNGGSGGAQHRGGSGGAGGQGATPSADGQPGKRGVLGIGGSGGAGGQMGSQVAPAGGGGGGGYRGGGGGGGAAASYGSHCGNYYTEFGGGGGGGSSYIEPGVSRRRMWTGYKDARGNGLVIIRWT